MYSFWKLCFFYPSSTNNQSMVLLLKSFLNCYLSYQLTKPSPVKYFKQKEMLTGLKQKWKMLEALAPLKKRLILKQYFPFLFRCCQTFWAIWEMSSFGLCCLQDCEVSWHNIIKESRHKAFNASVSLINHSSTKHNNAHF